MPWLVHKSIELVIAAGIALTAVKQRISELLSVVGQYLPDLHRADLLELA